MGELAVFDISESGEQIGEKLLAFLDLDQRKGLEKYIREYGAGNAGNTAGRAYARSGYCLKSVEAVLTEIREGDLYFCLEQRTVRVCGQEVMLTAKEFDILALLICNPSRVFTFEMIMELVWDGEGDFYSRKAIINHASNPRKKLKVSDTVPDYIKSVRGIGYKFVKN